MPKKPVDERHKEPLTAVLLADSFSVRFRPITVERPKALIPLVNSPMIEYALEWLASSRVEVCHVVCCAHADAIKSYLEKCAKWEHSSMTIHVIRSYNCLSAGEALRLVDQGGFIKDDFILLSLDTVTNMNLTKAVEEHKARRAIDGSAIMTTVLSPRFDEVQRIQMGIGDLAVAIDPDTDRLLAHVTFSEDASWKGVGSDRSEAQSAVHIDTTFFSERDAVELRYDLADTGIHICAPEVLLLFSDNFDFQHIQRDFIPGVLAEEELGNKLFVHLAEHCYAARVANMRAYAAISFDILMRWSYPLVPDSNLIPAATHAHEHVKEGQQQPYTTYYFNSQHYLYKESGVTISRGARIEDLVCLGAGTSVGTGAVVRRSVLGRHCHVGDRAVIENSFLMANVIVRDGAHVRDAIVCDDAVIGAGALVGRGAVVSFNCVVGARHTLAPYARISLCQTADEDDPDDSSVEMEAQGRRTLADGGSSHAGSVQEYGPSPATLEAARCVRLGQAATVQFDTEAVGPDGAGFDYAAQQGCAVTALDELTSVALPRASVARQRVALLGAPVGAGGGGGGGGEDDDDDDENDALVGGSGGLSGDPENVFKREVQETLLRVMALAAESNGSRQEMMDNAILELNGLKIAEVRSFADCARYVLTTIMSLQAPAPPDVAPAYRDLYAAEAPDVSTKPGQLQLLRAFTARLDAWSGILRKFLHDADDQIELLLTLEEYCGARGVFGGPGEPGRLYVPVFSHVLVQLYEKDVVVEDVFLTWEQEKAGDDEDDQEFLRHAAKFLDWLKQDSDDDDDDESDSASDAFDAGDDESDDHS